ncbi:M56 family metallopeptidase [Paenibacillus sp. FSL K6-0276]|uniref:M56 family metallopeptidase n=1 Tax=Paenibacillus sp. FSL K6-0276 TaxID=2921450 RepID=UPI0030EDA6D9
MEQLFGHILNMSITGSYVIVFIIVARLFLRKVPKIFSYALWSVVLFRLLCPYSIESIFSFIPSEVQNSPLNKQYIQTPQIQNVINTSDQAVNNISTVLIPATSATSVGMPPVNSTDTWMIIGQYIWLIGIALLLIYSIVATVRLLRNLRAATPLFENVYERIGITTPFVFGFLKPRIYLPSGLSDNEKAYIIKHEQVHIHRYDHIIKPLAFTVLCIHWFNPVVWLAFYLMSDDMEKSCDERVIRQMGSGIKKEYSTSLLSLSTGKRFMGGSPLAFGESNTKGRIKNVLNYKKPTFWVVLVAIIVVLALCVGLISNPKNDSLTVKDYAEQFMNQNITSYENGSDIKIINSQITKLEKIASFDDLLATPLEIWSLEYRLKPDDPSKLTMTENVVDGFITEEGSMGKPMLLFSIINSTPHYLGVIRSGENDMSTPAGQEMAVRVFLESNHQLPHETYSGNHMLVKFPLTTGETSQLLLSQPVVQGDSGIWCVERWKDTNGNEYYNTPQTDVTIAEYYARQQTLADQGEEPALLDPLQVAMNYISNNIGMGQHVKLDQLVVNKKATAEDFASTPESTLMGYVLNLNMDNHSFDFDNIEWLTMEDSARFKGLNINPDEDMPNGVYILNKYTYTDPLEVTDETRYSIVDTANAGAQKEVSKQEFIEYFKQYTDFVPPCVITTKDGYVTSIAEKYVPEAFVKVNAMK